MNGGINMFSPKSDSDFLCTHEEEVKRVNENMPDEEMLLDLADLFKIFGDTTRIKILCVLLESEMCVFDIAKILSMSQSAISHQLRVLKQSKLIKGRREGKVMYYSLSDDHVKDIISKGLEHIEE